MNRLAPKIQADIFRNMMERQGPRALSRTIDGNSRTRTISINTVYKSIADGGDAAIEFLHRRMRQLPVKFVEADEAYIIIGRNPAKMRRGGDHTEGFGAFWLWVAIDPETKLVLSWRLGKRTKEDADAFIADLHSRLAGRVQITTDWLPRYVRSIEKSFGADVDYARVKKRSHVEEEKRNRMELAGLHYRRPELTAEQKKKLKDEDKPERQIGNPDLARATTNHIEVFWTQMRKNISRMTRRTTLISKTFENMERVIALYVFYHNFIKKHKALKTTPAIAAGIDDDVWTWGDFVTLLYDFQMRRADRVKQGKAQLRLALVEEEARSVIHLPDQSRVEPSKEFCVFQSLTGDGYVKLHKSSCPHLRIGEGRAGVKGGARKLFCDTLKEARALAATLNHDETMDCKICLRGVGSRGQFGAAGRTSG